MLPTLPLLVSALLAQARVAPTRGVLLPGASIVGDDDATAVETNPGALGFSAGSLALVAADLDDRGRQWGQGVGLFGNLRLGALSNALGVQILAPPDAFAVADATKLTYALALRMDRSFGMGAGFHWFVSDEDRALDALFSTDIGLTFRPWSLLGVGLVVRDANTPRLGSRFLERRYDVGSRCARSAPTVRSPAARTSEETGDATPRAPGDRPPARGAARRRRLRRASTATVSTSATGAYRLARARPRPRRRLRQHRLRAGRPQRRSTRRPGARLGAGVRVGEALPSGADRPQARRGSRSGGRDRSHIVRLLAHLRARGGSRLRRGDRQADWPGRRDGDGRGCASASPAAPRRQALTRTWRNVRARPLPGDGGRSRADRSERRRAPGGMRASVLYCKGTLDRLGVRADIVKIAE